MPMVAISTYSIAVPTFDAPAPSICRARVKLSSRPTVVAITTIQKKVEVRLNSSSFHSAGNVLIHSTSGVARKCARPVVPRPMPRMIIRSVSVGLRACCA